MCSPSRTYNDETTDNLRRIEAENARLRMELARLTALALHSPIPDPSDRDLQAIFDDLRKSQASYRAIVQDQTEIISRLRADGTFLFVNDVYCRFFGKTADELVGSRFHPIVHPDDLAQVAEKLAMLSPSNPVVMIENRVFSGGGRCRWMQFSNRGTFSPSGVLSEIQSVGRDITDRKEVETALQESNDFNHAVLDSVAASVAVVDRDGLIVAVNESWRRFARDNAVEPGTPAPGTGVGSNYFSVCGVARNGASDEGMAARRGIQAVLDGQVPTFRLEYPCHSPTQRRWFVMIVMPLGQNLEDGAVITHTDITLVKQAEEQLRIAAVAFNAQSGMIITDADSVILQVNEAFTEITGYSAEEVVGQTPRLLKSGRHDPEFFRTMWESIERTGSWQGEIWDRRKNGEEYQKWLTISAVKDQDGATTHYVGAQFDISERKQAEERIRELAFFDQLTGLPNRTLLLDRLRQAIAASSRTERYAALLFIDLDNFKTLNDTLGHDMGDSLLKQVAQRLNERVRESDTVARLGGDEFTVLLTELSANESEAAAASEKIAEAILASLKQPYQLGEIAHRSTASIGITVFTGAQASTDSLMKQADLAMYRSKVGGRNRIHFFDPSMESTVLARAALEEDLRSGIEQGQLLLHFQPQVADQGRLTGAEALVRWQHPRRGMVSPAEIIPLAEDTGLILPLGHWVMETACAQLAHWGNRPEMERLTLSVNVSVSQFRQPDFVNQVLAIIERTGANPQRLKLELTETLLAENIQTMIATMHRLKDEGIGFSLDDFGTGYSSLYY